MRRTIIVSLAGLAAVSTLVGRVGIASAKPDNHRNSFTSETSRPTELVATAAPGRPRAELCNADSGACLVGYVSYDRLAGSLDGTFVSVGTLSLDFRTGLGWATSLGTFVGSVRGCPGEGTATLRFDVKLGAEPGKNIGTFSIVESSGTRGLAAISGRGSIVATPNRTTGTITTEGTAHVSCDTSEHDNDGGEQNQLD